MNINPLGLATLVLGVIATAILTAVIMFHDITERTSFEPVDD